MAFLVSFLPWSSRTFWIRNTWYFLKAHHHLLKLSKLPFQRRMSLLAWLYCLFSRNYDQLWCLLIYLDSRIWQKVSRKLGQKEMRSLLSRWIDTWNWWFKKSVNQVETYSSLREMPWSCYGPHHQLKRNMSMRKRRFLWIAVIWLFKVLSISKKS